MPSVVDVSSHASPRRIWELGTPAVRALAVFAVAVAILAGVLAWRARPRVEPVGPPTTLAASSTASSGYLVVAVSGKVRRPGLVRLPAGSRVADAIDAAGGVLPGTDLSQVNLAKKVSDGELVAIGVPAASSPSAGGPVNLNTATLEQLQTLPGVGPVLAQRIIDYREQHGGFATVADLLKVSGVGDARYNDLKNRVTV